MSLKQCVLILMGAPVALIALLLALVNLQGTLNGSCGDAECIPTNDTFTRPLEKVYDLLVPYHGFFVVLLLVAVVIAIVYFTLAMAAHMLDPEYESEEDFVAEMDIAQAASQIDHSETNRAQVIGWQYGLDSGVISLDDLRTMEPAALQERLDLDNPSHEEIFRLSQLIELHERATDRRHVRRRDRMIRERDNLRTHSEALHLNALSGQVGEAIRQARAADRSVRELLEG